MRLSGGQIGWIQIIVLVAQHLLRFSPAEQNSHRFGLHTVDSHQNGFPEIPSDFKKFHEIPSFEV